MECARAGDPVSLRPRQCRRPAARVTTPDRGRCSPPRWSAGRSGSLAAVGWRCSPACTCRGISAGASSSSSRWRRRAVSRSRCSSRPGWSRSDQCAPSSRSVRSRPVPALLLALGAARLLRVGRFALDRRRGGERWRSVSNPAGRSSSEIRRIVLRQLEAATSELKSIGDPESDEAVHDARRRVKKIRAVIRLVRPALDKTLSRRGQGSARREPPARTGRRRSGHHRHARCSSRAATTRLLPKRVVASLRAGLIERGSQTDRQADSDHVLQTAAGTLRGRAPSRQALAAADGRLRRARSRSRGKLPPGAQSDARGLDAADRRPLSHVAAAT